MNLNEHIKHVLVEESNTEKNLLGKRLRLCSTNPMTGYFRDGLCKTNSEDRGTHTVCATVTRDFLKFTKSKGNDLSTSTDSFEGLKPGNKWCLCAKRWKEAYDAGVAPKVDKRATNLKTIDIIGNSIYDNTDMKSINESEDLKKPFMKYEKLINMLVYEVFDEGICGFSWETFELFKREGTSLRIILHFTHDSVKEFGYEKYAKKKEELKEWILDFLPKFKGIFIVYDTTKCKDSHKQEETEGVGGYAAPAFEMQPDHVHFKHLYNESELTERCWKGYTQKGMKTMFGKRYPNCVKIKKKKTIKESIRNILLQEVNKKYSKPTPKIEQLVYRWLNDYFDGAKMYYDKSWETRHDFEWCNHGKEIMKFILFFEDNIDVYDDRRKTEERDFDSGSIYIPNDIFKDLMSDIPVRASYLKYLIEEWFDDTYLGEIQSKMGRNDIYISQFNIDDRDAQTCVPPMTKPEGVTEEDMIELILKTTLFRRDGILKQEEENPGWIEKTYLEKLRNVEYDRLRGLY